MPLDEIDWIEALEEEEPSRDPAVDHAKDRVRALYALDSDAIYYQQQLEVLFEREFFHWITKRGLDELLAEERLLSELVPIPNTKTNIRIYRTKSNRNWKRRAEALAGLVSEFAPVTPLGAGLGPFAEVMFDSAFGRRGFTEAARKVREWDDRCWSATKHDLDRVYVRDGIAYGVEMKNTLKYIPKDELGVKLEMCRFLGLRPLFIVRASPKSYNWEVIKAGGFALVFGDQLYPFGFDRIAEEVRRTLGLPVACFSSIPDGTIQRFVGWHEKKLAG